MSNEITARPLVDILSEQLGEQVVMSGEDYVLLSNKSVVATAAVELALATQQAELLESAKTIKLEQIQSDFAVADEQPVSYLGFNFSGGAESVTAIDGYVRLNRIAGITTHNIWDVNGDEHTLSDSQVDELIIAIGSQASAAKFTKKNRKVALASATSIAEVEAI